MSELVRVADAHQYARPPIPEEQRGQIRVRLLNMMPDPLGSLAALCAQYEGRVVRDFSQITDSQRRQALEDMTNTVLNGPLEVIQFHLQVEGVDRALTHQMVRSRASFFAQESLRFAVPDGNWADEVMLPPSLVGTNPGGPNVSDRWRSRWDRAMAYLQEAYAQNVAEGMPAEEARGLLPHAMPTRLHWVCDYRTLLAESGKRTCTQAQFPWRLVFAGIAKELREFGERVAEWQLEAGWEPGTTHEWQFNLLADKLRPDCYQKGRCTFMAQFDRSCSIRARVNANAELGRPSSEWSNEHDAVEGNPIVSGVGTQSVVRTESGHPVFIGPIQDWEWAADPAAARKVAEAEAEPMMWACSAAAEVKWISTSLRISKPGDTDNGYWWHKGSQTRCGHPGEPVMVPRSKNYPRCASACSEGDHHHPGCQLNNGGGL